MYMYICTSKYAISWSVSNKILQYVIKLLPFSSFTSDGKQKFRSASLASWQSMGSKALGKKTSCWSSLILMQDSCLSNCTCMIYQGTSKDKAYKNSSYNFSRILFSSRQLIFFGLSINILMYFPNFRSA